MNESIYKHSYLLVNSPNCEKDLDTVVIEIENEHWQVLKTSNGTFKMFNAYYDIRNYFAEDPVIKILAYINRVDPGKIFCQMRFKDVREPLVIEAHEYRVIWHKEWGINSLGSQPFLISCRNPLAFASFVPSSVSLVEQPCDVAHNNLKVIYNQPNDQHKKPFAVCVKDLDFLDDQSMQLIEWIEILSILGAEKIFVYVVKLHPKMIKILKYYKSRGMVELEMITEPEGLPTKNQSLTQWLQNQLISLNDCLYKHMYEYDYLAPLDMDEIIVPKREDDKTWKDFLYRTIEERKSSTNKSSCAFSISNVFFLSDNEHEHETQPEVPENFQFLQHVYRATNFSKSVAGMKSFQSTERVLAIHNHFPMICIGQDYIDFQTIDKDIAQLQHYRRGCENYPKDECDDFKQNTIKDKSLWKHKDEIIANVRKSLEEMKYFPDTLDIEI